jgi:hypothetical protein
MSGTSRDCVDHGLPENSRSFSPEIDAPDDYVTWSQAWFTPVLAKHSKSFSLVDAISVGVDRMQRNFDAHAKTGGSLAEN